MPLPLLVVLAGAAVLWSAEPRASGEQGPRTREIYVSVLDGKDAPVPGLTAADFVVREDGMAREVLAAGPATNPMQIALLVDDSQAATEAIPYIRDALTRFIEKMQGKAEIAILTVGERTTPLVEYTSNAELLKRGIGRIFGRPASGAYLLDAILDANRGLEKRKADRPVIVALSVEGVEFSNRHHKQVLDPLLEGNATLHVLALGSPSSSQAEEMRNRAVVLSEGTSRTGGRFDQILALSSLADRLARLADEMTAQYLVRYGRPEKLIPPQKVEVSVTRPGVKARARTRLPEK